MNTKPASDVLPSISQIPGLSTADADQQTGGPDNYSLRKWICDTDTDYVKLAKSGGRKSKLIINCQQDVLIEIFHCDLFMKTYWNCVIIYKNIRCIIRPF